MHSLILVLGDVLMFVYTDSCTITEDYVSELLTTADEFLLPGREYYYNYVIMYKYI